MQIIIFTRAQRLELQVKEAELNRQRELMAELLRRLTALEDHAGRSGNR